MIVSPSFLAGNLLRIEDEIKRVEASGADWHHVDVMDGHFVPNLTFGLEVVTRLKKIATIPLDVHLMIGNSQEMALKYAEAGSDIVTVHVEESSGFSPQLLGALRRAGSRVGLALSPDTPAAEVSRYLDDIDLVLVMSVHPGFAGQPFIEGSVKKVADIRKMIVDKNRSGEVVVGVDGGINEATGKQVADAGADVLVAGSHVFGAVDYREPIEQLRSLKNGNREHWA